MTTLGSSRPVFLKSFSVSLYDIPPSLGMGQGTFGFVHSKDWVKPFHIFKDIPYLKVTD
jgi:hypothetical protein